MKHLSFAHTPTVLGDSLIGALVFDLSQGPIQSVGAIYINDQVVPVEDYRVYLGEQETADPMLLATVRGWTPEHVFKGVPYIALRARFAEQFVSSDHRLKFTADVK